MNTVDVGDGELAARLRRLEAGAGELVPGFDYAGMLERHDARKARARRRLGLARGTAGALVLVMIAVSAWRLDRTGDPAAPVSRIEPPPQAPSVPEQRLVRADTYLALAAIEEHIASIDDALSDARMLAPPGGRHSAEVARLERTRAELLDSYAHVRYADLVAANF
jgi:hypothetical protein